VITRDELVSMPRSALMRVLREGHPVDPARLDDTEYRGVALGLPAFVERLTWKTFQKTFHRDPATGHLRGWNVRLEQRGLDAPSVPLRAGGEPVTFGHYRVVALDPSRAPRGLRTGILIDYGLGDNARLDPMGLMRDPLVAVHPGSVELLLGWSWIALGPMQLGTPSFFTLERERALTHRVKAPRSPG
jgi:hypothetical protein